VDLRRLLALVRSWFPFLMACVVVEEEVDAGLAQVRVHEGPQFA
jgi:hypothetical protein